MSDAVTPVVRVIDKYVDLLCLHDAHPDRYPCFLESVAHGNAQARFDILFAFPDERIALPQDFRLESEGVENSQGDFLKYFDQLWLQNYQKVYVDPDIPFYGGWFMYLGYELASQVEPALKLYPDQDSRIPIAFAQRFPAAVIRDHALKKTIVVAETQHAEKLAALKHDVDSCPSACETDISLSLGNVLEEDPSAFLHAVDRIRHYIVEGDVFQVNLSRRWQAELAGQEISAARLFASLRKTNPAPFAGLYVSDDYAIISSSPERLVCVKDSMVETRPIAGTRPRGDKSSADFRLSQTLLNHPKERAEHIMLIDLERNDLGRVCVAGSVKVNELMVVESYAHVHHIVSNVRGVLGNSVTPGQVLRAVFPGGTITGCPKVRCMQIIAELEQAHRGPYTGSMGYINHDGNMDFNILIRTMVREEGSLTFRAGAGIVADSIAEKELKETRDKAKGMLLSLGLH
ncbi:MAG: aminodeoxychorismate synthase component I [Gammaproteobacteria bacterium]